MTEIEKDTWAVLELMGHRVRAGKLSEVEIAGAPMLRIDLPVEGSETDYVTEYYGASGVYSICPTEEAIIRDQHYGKKLRPMPMRYVETPLITGEISSEDVTVSYDDEDEAP